MVKSTGSLVREAEIELSFQLPLGFTSSVPSACPPVQFWFIFSEFSRVALAREAFIVSLSINRQKNFSRKIFGNLCCCYLDLTCTAYDTFQGTGFW